VRLQEILRCSGTSHRSGVSWYINLYTYCYFITLIYILLGQVKFQPLKDPGTTGNFEITIVETGELVHSKITRGQGKCESNSERAALCDKIKEFLDK